MFLSDRDIVKRMESKDITIYPFHEDCLTPIGYQMHLLDVVKFYRGNATIDFEGSQEEFEKKHLRRVELSKHNYELLIRPRESVLVGTFEELGVSRKVGGMFVPSMISRSPLYAQIGVLVPGWNENMAGIYSICLTNLSDEKAIRIKASYKKDNKVHIRDQIGRIVYGSPSSEVLQGYDDAIYAYPHAREPQPPVSWLRYKELKKRPIPLDPKKAPKGSKLVTDIVESLDFFADDNRGKKRRK